MQKLTEILKKVDKSKLKKHTIVLAIELLIVGVLIAIDLITKHFIFEALHPENKTLTIIDGFVYFNTATNTGAAFSIFDGNALALGFVSLFAALLILGIQIATLNYRNGFLRSSIIMILAGAIGNLVDRFSLGYVRDFVDLDWIFDWVGVFNFADSCLTVGVVIMLIYVIFFFSRDNKIYEENKRKRKEMLAEMQEEANSTMDKITDENNGQD